MKIRGIDKTTSLLEFKLEVTISLIYAGQPIKNDLKRGKPCESPVPVKKIRLGAVTDNTRFDGLNHFP